MSHADEDRPTAVTGRRQVLGGGATAAGAGLLGISTLVLPSAAAAASPLLPDGVSAASLVFHLDASRAGGTPSTTWLDLSGNGNHGDATALGVTYDATLPDQEHYSFDGTAVVPVGSGSVLTAAPPDGYTKMVWFRRDRASGARHDNLISAPAASAAHFMWFNAAADATSHQLVTAGHNSVAPGIPRGSLVVGADVWTFAAVTFSTAGGLSLLTNTSDRSWAASTSEIVVFGSYVSPLSGGMAFQLGGFAADPDFNLWGDIAVAVVHERALTVDEVKAFYAATVDRFHA